MTQLERNLIIFINQKSKEFQFDEVALAADFLIFLINYKDTH
jgi:hypothetical protein